jgi:hypothetical protein
MTFRRSVALVFLPCLLTTIGCVHNQRFQPSGATITPVLANGKNGALLGVVEFDAMGQLWDRCSLDTDRPPCQLRTALDYIKNQRLTAQSNNEEAVVVTFVHGWRHNAESKDDNLRSFSAILQTLQGQADIIYGLCHKGGSRIPRDRCPQQHARFIGVYVAWRGQVVRTPLDYATVFDRELGAERTALVSMSEVLTRIRNAAKQTSVDQEGLPAARARFLLFGHSYGGLIVERAMSQMLISSLAPEHQSEMESCADGTRGVRPFADLILLINPAADAIEANQTIDLMKRSKAHRCSPYPGAPGFNTPIIVSIHARNDAATGKTFAAGHFLEQVNKAFRNTDKDCEFCNSGVGNPPSESFLFRHTPGHAIYLANFCYVDKEFTGDWVCEEVKNRVQQAKVAAGFPSGDTQSVSDHVAKLSDAPHRAALLRNLTDLLAAPVPDPANVDPSLFLNLYRRSATPDPKHPDAKLQPWNDTPYWIFTVPKVIVNQHGGFWTTEFTSFVSGLVTATTPPGGTTLQIQ